MLLLVLTMVAISLAFPAGDEPHLFIKVSNPGGAGSFGTQVSKTRVNLENNGKISEDIAYPHVPPFLAFKEFGAVYAKPPPSPQYFPSPEKPIVKRKIEPPVEDVAANDEQES
jgi:hypothetical protein